ncbi:MAG: ORF6N domain-containing protein, partial [Rikenellaceae bacterium]
RGIMRAFVEMRKYLISNATISAELAELRARLQILERNDEENMAAINDLSEDLRRDIDNIYNAIAELSVKTPKIEPQRKPIGFNIERK